MSWSNDWKNFIFFKTKKLLKSNQGIQSFSSRPANTVFPLISPGPQTSTFLQISATPPSVKNKRYPLISTVRQNAALIRNITIFLHYIWQIWNNCTQTMCGTKNSCVVKYIQILSWQNLQILIWCSKEGKFVSVLFGVKISSKYFNYCWWFLSSFYYVNARFFCFINAVNSCLCFPYTSAVKNVSLSAFKKYCNNYESSVAAWLTSTLPQL